METLKAESELESMEVMMKNEGWRFNLVLSEKWRVKENVIKVRASRLEERFCYSEERILEIKQPFSVLYMHI